MTEELTDYDLGFQDGANGLLSLHKVHPSDEYAKGYEDGYAKYLRDVFPGSQNE